MSYILDALKKSEQERGHGNIPDVQTVHSSSLNYRNEKKAYWPYILISAVILNLLAIVYFIANKETPATATVTEQAQQKNIEVNPTPEDSFTAEKAVRPENLATVANNKNITPEKTSSTVTDNIAIIEKQSAIKAEATDSSEKPRANKPLDIIDFNELPASIKQDLPAIIISAHVYSSNPIQRSIVINNNFMEEGEYVLDGLILYEITRDGAIFNYQGTLFSYGVVSGWQ